MMNKQKADNICGMIKLDETTLKLVDGVLTTVATTEVGEVIKAPCGGFKLDGNVFGIDEGRRYTVITRAGETASGVNLNVCGEIEFDAAAFEITRNKSDIVLSLKAKVVPPKEDDKDDEEKGDENEGDS